MASAMPISRLRCSPCERLAASSSALPQQADRLQHRLRLVDDVAEVACGGVNMLQPCRRDCAAMRTFSSVVAFGRMLVIW